MNISFEKNGNVSAAITINIEKPDYEERVAKAIKALSHKVNMPKQLSEEELTAALTEIIAQVGATSAKDMGKVMGVATKQLAGKAEGKAISAKVRELLA